MNICENDGSILLFSHILLVRGRLESGERIRCPWKRLVIDGRTTKYMYTIHTRVFLRIMRKVVMYWPGSYIFHHVIIVSLSLLLGELTRWGLNLVETYFSHLTSSLGEVAKCKLSSAEW